MKKFTTTCITGLLLLVFTCQQAFSQNGNCVFKDTLLKIDFGSTRAGQEFNLRVLKNYQRSLSTCPDDGFYSYSTQTSNCFNGDWITLNEDHTPNDIVGKMFLVNAANSASAFFITALDGFKKNTRYEFGVWMMNLCKVNRPCPPLPPNIIITLQTSSGKILAKFKTGQIASAVIPSWKKYFAYFTTPADETLLTLKMENQTNGGCGNDFTMDDITFRECYPVLPVAIKKEKITEQIPETKPVASVQKTVVKEQVPDQLKKAPAEVKKMPAEEKPVDKKLTIKKGPVNMPLPEVILSRENPVVKTIVTEASTMLIELYDNGQVDGDTVSIYHNNKLVISHAGLSEKPVTLRIKVDAENPHHELTMVADNLGSIPPNTSLMVITAAKKRYEVFISSSEQKNARLLIDLKE